MGNKSRIYSAAEKGKCEKVCEAFSTVPARGKRSINGACHHYDCEHITMFLCIVLSNTDIYKTKTKQKKQNKTEENKAVVNISFPTDYYKV